MAICPFDNEAAVPISRADVEAAAFYQVLNASGFDLTAADDVPEHCGVFTANSQASDLVVLEARRRGWETLGALDGLSQSLFHIESDDDSCPDGFDDVDATVAVLNAGYRLIKLPDFEESELTGTMDQSSGGVRPWRAYVCRPVR